MKCPACGSDDDIVADARNGEDAFECMECGEQFYEYEAKREVDRR